MTAASAMRTGFRLPGHLTASLGEIRCGTLHLTVPLHDGVIQLGSAGAGQTATIAVDRAPAALTVRRTDGRLLQAQIIRCEDGGGVARDDVFTDPVDRLRLERIGPPGGRSWIIAAAAVHHPARLMQLVETILAFSLHKQRRAAS